MSYFVTVSYTMEINITASFVTYRLKGPGQRPASEGQGGDHGQGDLQMQWEEPGSLANVGGCPEIRRQVERSPPVTTRPSSASLLLGTL